jgi:hypothetical protein
MTVANFPVKTSRYEVAAGHFVPGMSGEQLVVLFGSSTLDDNAAGVLGSYVVDPDTWTPHQKRGRLF